MKLLITNILAVVTKRKSEMMSYLNNGYDVMNYFAEFEKFLPQYNYTKFYDCRKSRKSIARVTPGGGGGASPPYKLGSQNTPYKLGLRKLLQKKYTFYYTLF